MIHIVYFRNGVIKLSLNLVLQFLPSILSTVLGGILGYLFGVRTRKIDRFFGQVQENLNKVSSPLFHDIRIIERQFRSCERQRLLKDFFNKYGAASTMIYQIGNKSIWEQYYQLEDKYYTFYNQRTQENWNDFWICFHLFSSRVKTEYRINTMVMFREYDWMRFISGKGLLSRFFHEFSRICYETFKTLSFASLFLIYIILWDSLIGNHMIPKDIKSLCFSAIGYIIFPLWGFSMMLATRYIASTSWKLDKSIIQLFIERKFPRIAKRWDKIFSDQPKRVVEKIKTPEM